MWNVCSKPFKNAEYVFPTQQNDVFKIISAAKKDPNIKKVIVFGSSVTSACNPWSDIDVYFELNEDNPANIDVCGIEVPVDKWDNFSVDERLRKEIDETGVVVYEK